MYKLCRPGEPKIQFRLIPRGRAGTLKTVKFIIELIKNGAKDFCVRQKAIDIFFQNGIQPKDYWGEIKSLFNWVQKNIRFTRDIYRVETLHSARRILELKAGDCDDMTIILGSMLKSTGHPIRLVIVGFRPERPHSYSHIYLEVCFRGRWVPLDATMQKPMGWAPPAIWKKICKIK